MYKVVKLIFSVIYESVIFMLFEFYSFFAGILLRPFKKNKPSSIDSVFKSKNSPNFKSPLVKTEEERKQDLLKLSSYHSENTKNEINVDSNLITELTKTEEEPKQEIVATTSVPTIDKQKPHRKHKFVKFISLVFVFFSSILAYFVFDLPDYTVLSNYNPQLITRIYSADGSIISEIAKEKRMFIPIDALPKNLKEAFISAEDKSFYTHYGFDFYGILRASFNSAMFLLGNGGNLEGASTITQQVAKNFLLSSDRTIKRKAREAILTLQIESQYSKDHILELYLNQIYLGRGSYGVTMAALNYFNKPVTELSLGEMAFLAIMPKAPSKYDPANNYNLAKDRRDWVIDRMLKDGKISELEAKKAKSENINYKKRSDERSVKASYASEEIRKDLIKKFGYSTVYNGGLIVKTTVNYQYQEYAYDSLRSGIIDFDNRKGYRESLLNIFSEHSENNKIFLNNIEANSLPRWRNIIKNNPIVLKYKNKVYPWSVAIVLDVKKDSVSFGLNDGFIPRLELQNNKWIQKNPKVQSFEDILKVGDVILVEELYNKTYILRQIPEINGAILAMNPQTGDILAMQGGFSFLLSEFNRTTQALRQPGSSFKPFVYMSAIAQGYNPVDLVLDAPVIFDNSDGSKYRPKNDGNKYSGYVTLRNALEFSRNYVSLRIADIIGIDKVSNVAQNFGIYENGVDNFSEILGSKEVSLLTMVKAYSMLANGGKKIESNIINLVQNSSGEVIYKHEDRSNNQYSNIPWDNQSPPVLEEIRQTVANPQDVYIIVNMLQGVVQRGTGRYAQIPGYNIAGKTGTTNDTKDVWFIGFSPDLVVGVYLGADEPKKLDEQRGATSIAVPVFSKFMKKAMKNKEALPFRVPDSMVSYWVNYKTGKLSSPNEENSILEYFKDSNIPTANPKTLGSKSTPSHEETIISTEDGIY